MIRSSLRPAVVAALAMAVSLSALSACSADGGTNANSENDSGKTSMGKNGSSKTPTGKNDSKDGTIKMKGNSELDTAAYSLQAVMSSKFSDYEIEGNTVYLIVRDGATLSGSECIIVTSAVAADNPGATFVIDDHGTKTTCEDK